MILKIATGSKTLQEIFIDSDIPPSIGARVLYYSASKSINSGIIWSYDIKAKNTKVYAKAIFIDDIPLVNRAFIEASKDAGDYYIYPPWTLMIKMIPSIMLKYVCGFLDNKVKNDNFIDHTLKRILRLLGKRKLSLDEAYKKYKKPIIDMYIKKGFLALSNTPEFVVSLNMPSKHYDYFKKSSTIKLVSGDYKIFLQEYLKTLKGQTLIILPSKNMFKDFEHYIDDAYFFESPKNVLEAFDYYKSAMNEDKIFVTTSFGLSLPFYNLKSIFVIDDMYSEIYKSRREPFVDYRRMAYYVAKHYGAEIYYASNTLSVNGYFLYKEKKAEHFYVGLQLPNIKIIQKSDKTYLIDKQSIDIVKQYLNKRILFYVNKSGYSYAYCEKCGSLDICPSCESYTTYFKDLDLLKCSKCGNINQQKLCSRCGGSLKVYGAGVEQYQEYITSIFGKRDNFSFLSFVSDEYFDIVFCFLLENLLFSPELSAREIYHNKLWRLASRAKELFVFETSNVDKYSLESLLKNNQYIFLEDELNRRKEHNDPPFTKTILIELKENADKLYQELITEDFFYISKPNYFYEKGEKRFRILLKVKNQANIRRIGNILNKYKNYKINVGIETFV